MEFCEITCRSGRRKMTDARDCEHNIRGTTDVKGLVFLEYLLANLFRLSDIDRCLVWRT